MSLLKKLSISGIRSFNPDNSQVIEFYAPLTMIVGANGCGKTTIIECLRYAVTGALPPSSRNGQTFVHDPKMEGASEIKAQIKLRFQVRNGSPIVIVRSLQVTQKKTSVTFKALDGVLKSMAEGGEATSTSLKCSDLDKQVPVLMGVSRAILESVIFCHQEESSWPLEEGAVLKKKFDMIFESSRYTKALDVIKTTRTELSVKVKDLKIELAGLKAHLEAATSLQADMDGAKAKSEQINADINALNDQIQQKEADLERCQEQLQQMGDIKRQLDQASANLGALQGRITEKESHMDQRFDDLSEDELRAKIAEFDSRLGTKRNELAQLQRQYQDRTEKAQSLQNKRDKLHADKGSIMSQIERQNKLNSDRESLATALAKKNTDNNLVLQPDQIPAFIQGLEKQLVQRQKNLATMRTENRHKEDQLVTTVNNLQIEQATNASILSEKEKELTKTQNRIGELLHELKTMTHITDADVKKSKEDAEKARKAYSDVADKRDGQALTKRQKDAENKRNEIQTSLNEVVAAIQSALANADERTEADVKEKSVAADKQRLLETAQGNFVIRNALKTDFTPTGKDDFEIAAAEIRSKRSEIDRQIAKLSTDGQELRHQQAQGKLLARQTKDRVTSTTNEKKKLEDGEVRQARELMRKVVEFHAAEKNLSWQINKKGDAAEPTPAELSNITFEFPQPPADNLGESVEYLRKEISRLKELKGTQVGQKYVFQHMLKMAAKSVDKGKMPKCKCCQRDMDEKAYEVFKLSMESSSGPVIEDKVNAIEARLQLAEDYFQQLEKLAPKWRQYEKYESDVKKFAKEATDAQADLDKITPKVTKNAEDVEKAKGEVAKLEKATAEISGLVAEANRVGRAENEVRQLKLKLERLSQAGMDSMGGSLSELQEKQTQLSNEKDEVLRELADIGQQLQRLSNQMLQLSNIKNEAEREEADTLATWRRLQKCKSDREEAANKCRELEQEVQACNEKESPARLALQTANEELSATRTENRYKEDQEAGRVQEASTDLGNIKRVSQALEDLVRQRLKEKAENMDNELTRINDQLHQTEAEQTAGSERMREIQDSEADEDRKRRAVEDNLALRDLQKQVKTVKTQVESYSQRLKDARKNGDPHRMAQDIQEELHGMKERRATENGRLLSLKEQIRDLKTKLNSSTYKGVQEKQRIVMIDHETTQVAVNDLEKYWHALDKALLRFHALKISEINKIIRELWQVTYKGGDIDMIEIVSGEEGGSTRAARSYNYRVAMRKGDTVMDMKGRCSAGQRVLASIVIRLALAETFCLNCGILALDEPTTNLDHDNKEGLAMALARIIATRSQAPGSSFQLIIITHDEDFLQVLRLQLESQTGFSKPQHYYAISREYEQSGQYYTRIRRKDW